MVKEPDKRDLVELADPFGEMPVAERKKLMKEIGVKARDKFEELKADLDNQLQPLEPIHCMCSAAYYMVFAVSGGAQGSDTFGQHNAELLQALLLRHPVEFYKAVVGTPDQVQAALDLAKNLATARLRIPYASMPEDDEGFGRARVVEAMRLHTQVMRGEYYPEQLKRLFRPCLERAARPFIAEYGIAPAAIFDLVRRLASKIEDRLNEHVKRVVSFYRQPSLSKTVAAYKAAFPNVTLEIDELRATLGNRPDSEILPRAKMMMLAHSDLRISDIFLIPDEEIEAELKAIDVGADVKAVKAIIDKLSMKLGDTADDPIDHIILDNPVWARPFVKTGDALYLPLPTTFTSYCLNIFLGLSQVSEKLKVAYEEARAKTLEEMVAVLLKEALPTATIWQSVKWKDAATDTVYENDTVVLIDRWLLVFEAKSGQITDSARRGSYDRLKREIKKLMVDPSDQSRRFAELLTAKRGVHEFECKGGACKIDSSALDGIVRVNITNESIGNLNSRGRDLVEAELVPKGTDLAPTMSLSSLDLVFQLIGLSDAIVHYLARRKPFEETAVYTADELDLVSLYLENGFNLGEREFDGTMLMIYGNSNHLDNALTVSFDQKLGKQASRANTEFWNDWLAGLENCGINGWLTAAMSLRNVGSEDQLTFVKPVRHGVYRYTKNGPTMGYAVLGPQARREGLIYLVRGSEFEKNDIERDMRDLYKKIAAEGVTRPLFLLIEPPKAGVVKKALIVCTEDAAVAAAIS